MPVCLEASSLSPYRSRKISESAGRLPALSPTLPVRVSAPLLQGHKELATPTLKVQLHLLGIQEMAGESMPRDGQKESVTLEFLKVLDFYFPQDTDEGGFSLPENDCFTA